MDSRQSGRRGIRRAIGSLWSKTSEIIRANKWIAAVLLAVAVAIAAAIVHRLTTVHSIYEANSRVDLRMQPLDGPKRGQKILIFAPHEDDETLGCAGFIQRAIAAEADVHVVMMTNGEYPEIDVFLFEETVHPSAKSFMRLGYMRQKETLTALRYLGVPESHVTFLGYPNGYLTEMWSPEHWLTADASRSRRLRTTRSPYRNSMTPNAPFSGESLLSDVETVLERERPDVVVTLHPNDIHVDHWPTGAFAQFALAELANRGEAFARDCKVYTYLIHRYWWPAPIGYHPNRDMEPPAALIDTNFTDWRKLEITRDETLRKHRAISFYRTQGGNADPLLRSFARASEIFGITRDYDWPSTTDVPERTVISDPVEDSPSAAIRPGSDIKDLRIERDGDRMRLTIVTGGKISSAIDYHVSIHAGNKDASERVIAQYDWKRNHASASMVKDGRHSQVPEDSLSVSTDSTTTTLEAPWPVSDADTFLVAQGWTWRRSSYMDKTAFVLFHISKTSNTRR